MNKLQTGAIVLAAACMAEAAPPGDRGTLDPPAADVHCHVITPGYMAQLEKHGALMDELYPIPAWSPEALGAFLDEAGIGLAVLTSVAILHPHRPEPFDAKLAEGLPLAMYEYPAETTRALARLFARNVPARYPNVKFVVPHAGAFLPLALPRMKAVHPIVRAKGLAGEIDWDANLRSLWFDLAGAPTVESVRRLLALTTPDRILYGSDFPYAPAPALAAGLAKLRAELAADPELAPHAEAILGGNARRLFGIANESHAESAEISGRAGSTSPPPPKPSNLEPANMKTCQPSLSNAIFRIAEIEVKPEFLDAYLAAAADVGATSVHEEPGVLCIFPMQDAERPTSIRIVEIYRDEAAYKSHLATPHFLRYKTGTPHMIESLRLAPMRPLDHSLPPEVFRKFQPEDIPAANIP